MEENKHLEEHFAISNLLNTTLHIEGDSLFFHLLAQTLGNIAIEGREALLEVLDDGYLRAKAIENACELHTNNASTDNNKALREGFEVQQARRIYYMGIVGTIDGQPLGFRACGDDNVIRGERVRG